MVWVATGRAMNSRWLWAETAALKCAWACSVAAWAVRPRSWASSLWKGREAPGTMARPPGGASNPVSLVGRR